MILWRIFNKPTTVAGPVRYVILDDDGTRTETDKAYIDLGMSEGWLTKTGYFENQYGFYWTYVLRK